MDSDEFDTSNNSNMNYNSDFNTTSIIQIRLDTSKIIEEIKVFLSGEIYTTAVTDDGVPYLSAQQIGTPKCNKDGLQSILSFISCIINSQVVQGNYDVKTWRENCAYIRNELTKNIIVGRKEWGISSFNAETIIDSTMNMVEPFLSRLIDNKERDSYSASIKVNETNSVSKKKGFFNGVFGG